MQYGIYLPNFGPYGEASRLAELAQEAEAADWDGFFIWDHIARAPEMGGVVDPWVALTAAAMKTRRIRLGALVTPLPRRRPWKVAKETVSLDALSGGRLVFGAGIGSGRAIEWENLGEERDARVRGEMLDEGLEVLAGLWSGEAFSYEGRHYRVGPTQFLPRPVQRPRIPVWVGGYWPNKAPLRRAARWDGAFMLFGEEGGPIVEQVSEMAEALKEYRGSEEPFEIVFRNDWVGREEAPELAGEVGRRGVTWWLEHIVPGNFGGRFEEAWPLEAMRAHIQKGPPRG